MTQEHLVEFEDYLAAIRRRRTLIVGIVAAFVVLGAGWALVSPKSYTSESRVQVTPTFQPGDGSTEEVNIDTERGIAQSSAVADIAAQLLRSTEDPSDLLDHVTVEAVGDSTILAIRYADADPQAAFRGADAFARAYLRFRTQQADEATRLARQQLQAELDQNQDRLLALEDQLADLTPGTASYAEVESSIRALDGAQSSLDRQIQELGADAVDPGTIIDEAEVPEAPSSPGLPLTVAGAGLIGLVLALSLTFVLERRNLGARPVQGGPSRPDEAALAAPVTPTPVAEVEPAPAPLPAAPTRTALPERTPVAPTETAEPVPAARPEPAPEPVVARPAPRLRPTTARPTPALALPSPAPTVERPTTPVAPVTAAPAVTPKAARDHRPAPTPAAPADRRQRRDPAVALGGLGVEVLGEVPRLSNDAGEAAFDAVALGGPSGEALRRLYAELAPRLARAGATVVFVTSAVERGVTVGLAGGLAATAALAGQDALLIAGDLRQPRLHDRLGLGNDQGLAEVLAGSRQLTHVLQGWSGIPTLCVVTAGRPGPDPSRLVQADRLAAQLATIRDEFGLVVIEGPPIGEAPDATVMASVSDAVVLAVDPRRSAEHELSGAVSALRLAKAPLLGAVVVEARAGRAGAALPAAGTPAAAPGPR